MPFSGQETVKASIKDYVVKFLVTSKLIALIVRQRKSSYFISLVAKVINAS